MKPVLLTALSLTLISATTAPHAQACNMDNCYPRDASASQSAQRAKEQKAVLRNIHPGAGAQVVFSSGNETQGPQGKWILRAKYVTWRLQAGLVLDLEGGDQVTIPFLRTSLGAASAMARAIDEGKAIDLSDCIISKPIETSESTITKGCVNVVYAPTLSCSLTSSTPVIDGGLQLAGGALGSTSTRLVCPQVTPHGGQWR